MEQIKGTNSASRKKKIQSRLQGKRKIIFRFLVIFRQTIFIRKITNGIRIFAAERERETKLIQSTFECKRERKMIFFLFFRLNSFLSLHFFFHSLSFIPFIFIGRSSHTYNWIWHHIAFLLLIKWLNCIASIHKNEWIENEKKAQKKRKKKKLWQKFVSHSCSLNTSAFHTIFHRMWTTTEEWIKRKSERATKRRRRKRDWNEMKVLF